MEAIGAVSSLGVIFTFIVILVWLDNRKKERMFLLSQGKDPNLADMKHDTSATGYLKWGIIIIGVGLGAFLGTLFGGGNGSIYISCLMIFSGIGLVVSFLVTRNIYSATSNSKDSGKPNESTEEQNNSPD